MSIDQATAPDDSTDQLPGPPPDRRRWPQPAQLSVGWILLRGPALSMVAGAVAGGVVGGLMLPPVGTVVGLMFGVPIGWALGVLCTLTLLLVLPLLTGRGRTAAGGAIVSVGWGAGAVQVLVPELTPVLLCAALAVCAVAGAVVAPSAVFGRRSSAVTSDRCARNPG